MTTTLLRAGTLACALMTSTCLTAPAFAQAQPSVYQHVDQYGVDLTDGSYNFSLVEGSIGSGEGAIQLVRHYGVGGPSDNLTAGFKRTQSGSNVVISLTFGNRREDFSGAASATSFTNEQGGGATLTKVSASDYVYTDSDGTVTNYEMPPGLSDAPNNAYCSTNNQSLCVLVPTATTRPNGHGVTYEWDVGENCAGSQCAQFWRLLGIDNSFGYRVRFTFVEPNNPSSGLPGTDWHRRATAALSNSAASGSAARTVSYDYPSSTETEVTTDGGETWLLTGTSAGLSAVRGPGSTSDDIAVSYAGSSAVVSQVTAGGVTAGYSRSVSGATATMVRTDALSGTLTVVSDLNVGRPVSVTDETSRTTLYDYDADGRLESVTAPEGNSVSYLYDSRGNVTEARAVAKAGSGLDPMVTTATYPSSCSNQVICNLPESTTDARGNVTNYSYDSNHGGVLTATAPAPGGGVTTRPQARYSYTLTNGETLLTGISACASGDATSGCLSTANETRTVIGYDANGNVTSLTRRDGTGGLTAPSAMTYDAHGNLLTVDGPLSGTADTVRFRYDAARRRVGTVSPDPDGGGSLKHRAQRVTFDSRGLATKIETGMVNSQSDSDWNSGFTSLERVEQVYDANRRPTEARLMSGTTTYALAQTGYDSLGRVLCVAQRMNPNEYGSAQPGACILDTTSSIYGPDRIARTGYDAAGRVTLVESALGTSDEADEAATTYTTNGQVETLTDAEGNRTTYVYDGHDRLSRTRFPCAATVSPCTLGASSTTDYEELTYLTATVSGQSRSTPLVASRRLRDTTSIAFTIDALNRVTARNLPGSEPDVAYAYDLLGRLTSAATSAQTLSFAHDALGRQTSETGPLGTVSSSYDAAGRRTQLTGPGSYLVGYGHLVTGEVTALLNGNGDPLASFAYDDRGRRTALALFNNTGASYAYDPVSRLTGLTSDLASAGSDLALTMSHNPASQIVTRSGAHGGYAYQGYANGSVSSSVNGLNQLTANGGTSVSHDARGNVSAIGSAGYTYSSENLMTGGPGGTSLVYDPLGRLYQVSAGGVTRRFLYDGLSLIGEYDGSGNVRHLYEHGPGVDEPLIWFDIAQGTFGTFHADERGSIVALANGSGSALAYNSYDEYGVPQGGTLTGRFGYTGQAWLPEIGMYHYRARIYDPNGGRFMQADPIGYEGGMNLYGYVGGDPVNITDPMGLDGCTGSRIAASCANNNSQGGVPSWSPGYSSEGWNGDFRIPKPASDGGGGGGSGDGDGGSLIKTSRVWLGTFSDGSQKQVILGTSFSFGNPGANFGDVASVAEGERVQMACAGPISLVCREILRNGIMRLIPKPAVPSLPARVSQATFGRAMGWPRNQSTFAYGRADVFRAVRNARRLGITQDQILGWQRFYRITAFRDFGNAAAANRASFLQAVFDGF